MPEDLTVALRELIVGMLEKDPAKRLRMPQLRVCIYNQVKMLILPRSDRTLLSGAPLGHL